MHSRFAYRDLENKARAGSLSPVKGSLSFRVELCCDENFLYWAECNLISDISLNSNFLLLNHALRNFSKAVMRLPSALYI